MIFMPFPRFVVPISDPPPLAVTNVASSAERFVMQAGICRAIVLVALNTRERRILSRPWQRLLEKSVDIDIQSPDGGCHVKVRTRGAGRFNGFA
jgi:hypothetical protein